MGRMPTYLKDLEPVDQDLGLQMFCESPAIARLGWPQEVVRQWLFEHGRHLEFLDDYGAVDLNRIDWQLEVLPVTELERVRTGPSEQDWLERVAAEHLYWLSRRPEHIRDTWEELGTWGVPPIFLSRDLLNPPGTGLQLVEGRMRVGIMQGRRAAGLLVGASHNAWVGRAAG